MVASASFQLVFISLTFLILPAVTTDIGLRAKLGTDVDWDAPPTASVYSERKELMPAHSTQAVELLRFVTAYKRGVEAFVDATPYSALLKATAETDGELTFFAFIDTWVGNNSVQHRDVMALSPDGQKCSATQKEEEAWGGGGTQGNGWQLDANLVFWPPAAKVDTRPRESVTISSGYYGQYSFGAITVHEGQMTGGGSQIELKEPTDLTGTLDAEVYPCPGGGKDVQRGLKMGQRARRIHAMGAVDRSALQPMIDEVYNEVKNDAIKDVTVVRTDPEKRQVEVTFDKNQLEVAAGTPAFYHADDIVVDGNQSYNADTVVGKVISVDGNKAVIQMSGACLPSKLHLNVPRLKLASAPNALANARKLADSLGSFNERVKEVPDEDASHGEGEDVFSLLAYQKKREDARRARKDHKNIHLNFDGPVFKPFLVGQNADMNLAPLPIVAQVDIGALEKKGITCAPDVLSLLQTEEHAESLLQEGSKVQRDKKEKDGIIPAVANLLRGSTLGRLSSEMPLAAAGLPISTPENMWQRAAEEGEKQSEIEAVGSSLGGKLKDGDKVCIMARRAQGRVFERKFQLPTFAPAGGADQSSDEHAGNAVVAKQAGDHVVLQFSVTGHGWSGSTEQCSEFCHAIYHININGQYAFNVTEWRDDCEKNPINTQQGTWTIPRNGWCPGSVEPGLYIDATKFLKNGENHIAVDASVYSSHSGKYQPYINYGGFSGGNNAVLDIGATLFVYDGKAVDAIKQQSKPLTAAEKALTQGSNIPEALHPPTEMKPEFAEGLAMPVMRSAEVKQHSAKLAESSVVAQKQVVPDNRYDFEQAAPWYLYDEKESGLPGGKAGAQIVHVFVDGLIQINSREIRIKVNKKQLPEDWSQLGVQLRLQRPGADQRKDLVGMEMDDWDRVGSLGVLFEESARSTTAADSMVKLHPSTGEKMRKRFELF